MLSPSVIHDPAQLRHGLVEVEERFFADGEGEVSALVAGRKVMTGPLLDRGRRKERAHQAQATGVAREAAAGGDPTRHGLRGLLLPAKPTAFLRFQVSGARTLWSAQCEALYPLNVRCRYPPTTADQLIQLDAGTIEEKLRRLRMGQSAVEAMGEAGVKKEDAPAEIPVDQEETIVEEYKKVPFVVDGHFLRGDGSSLCLAFDVTLMDFADRCELS